MDGIVSHLAFVAEYTKFSIRYLTRLILAIFMLTRESFLTILSLTQKQPWLEGKNDILFNLLANECDSEDKRSLLIELLDRFLYLSSDEFQKKLEELAESIVTDPELADASTQVVAMAADSSSDSSQLILYGIKSILERCGWCKYKNINIFSKAYASYKKLGGTHYNIVLIDEFVGSGSTVISRVSEIKRQFENVIDPNLSIRVKVIVATEHGLSKISKAGINIESLIVIKKGISDFNTTPIANRKRALMIDLESLLSKTFNDRNLPSLGYGESESLYSRDNGNTPNNVFPIFWWPYYKNNNKRQVLLTRAMGDA